MDSGLAAIVGAIVGALGAFGGAYFVERLRTRDHRQTSLGLILNQAALLSTYLDAAEQCLSSLVAKREFSKLPRECGSLGSVIEHMNFVLEALCRADHRTLPQCVVTPLFKAIVELNQLKEFLSLVAGGDSSRTDEQHAQAANEILGKIRSTKECVLPLALTTESRLSVLYRRRMKQELIELLPAGAVPAVTWSARFRNMLVGGIDFLLGTRRIQLQTLAQDRGNSTEFRGHMPVFPRRAEPSNSPGQDTPKTSQS